MIATIDDFVKYIPTARGTYFEDIEPFLVEASRWVETDLFGKSVVDKVDEENTDESVKRILNSIIALKAYSSAIPFLDVVQTPNGFAVVNNTNHAPASKERVDRLLSYVNERLYYHVDSMIDHIAITSALLNAWKSFPKFEWQTEIFFWSGTELAQIAGDFEKINTKEQPARRRIPYLGLQQLHVVIKGYQDEEIANAISRDYVRELVEKNRERSGSEDDRAMIRRLKFIIGLFLQGEEMKAQQQLNLVVNKMSADMDKYKTYADSEEYRLKIAERYVNKQEDPTYFFG